jgi:Transcriptional regulator, AbiEi antitoxin, Type IV TA system
VKSLNQVELEGKAEEVLRTFLGEIPFLKARLKKQPALDDTPVGFIADLQVGGVHKKLLIECKSTGEPRFVRDAVLRLDRQRQADPKAYAVFMAPYISPEAAALCAEENIGYIDFSGNCHFSTPPLFIHKEGHPNQYLEQRPLRSLYSPKSERILRTLLALHDPQKSWTLERLAKESDVSLGLVAKVCKLLADKEWIKPDYGWSHLSKPMELLKDWAQNYGFDRNTERFFYSMQGISELEKKLGVMAKMAPKNVALASFSAASRLAPMVRYQRAYAYVMPQAMPGVISTLKLKEVTGGHNLVLLEPYDEGVLYHRSPIKEVTAPVQTYLDLVSSKSRGEEAAEFLLDQIIKKAWKDQTRGGLPNFESSRL